MIVTDFPLMGREVSLPISTHAGLNLRLEVYFSVPQAILVESMEYMESMD